MILKHGLAKAILVSTILGVISGVIVGITKIEMPILGYAILGGIVAPISIGIYTWSNKK